MDYANNNNINIFMETSATSFDDVQEVCHIYPININAFTICQ